MNNEDARSTDGTCFISYNKGHMEIVNKGIDAISEVLYGTDMAEKESLLYCLDRYLDPWFGLKLPFEKELFELFQYVLISPNAMSVKEEALFLLENYSWPPFPILENNLDKIEPELMEGVEYVINMGA